MGRVSLPGKMSPPLRKDRPAEPENKDKSAQVAKIDQPGRNLRAGLCGLPATFRANGKRCCFRWF
jgi:hypothetical protein